MIQTVHLTTPVSVLIGRPGVRVDCTKCGKENINQREAHIEGNPICRSCAGKPYYLGEVMQNEFLLVGTQLKVVHQQFLYLIGFIQIDP